MTPNKMPPNCKRCGTIGRLVPGEDEGALRVWCSVCTLLLCGQCGSTDFRVSPPGAVVAQATCITSGCNNVIKID
jgi:hypothetical protein